MQLSLGASLTPGHHLQKPEVALAVLARSQRAEGAR